VPFCLSGVAAPVARPTWPITGSRVSRREARMPLGIRGQVSVWLYREGHGDGHERARHGAADPGTAGTAEGGGGEPRADGVADDSPSAQALLGGSTAGALAAPQPKGGNSALLLGYCSPRCAQNRSTTCGDVFRRTLLERSPRARWEGLDLVRTPPESAWGPLASESSVAPERRTSPPSFRPPRASRLPETSGRRAALHSAGSRRAGRSSGQLAQPSGRRPCRQEQLIRTCLRARTRRRLRIRLAVVEVGGALAGPRCGSGMATPELRPGLQRLQSHRRMVLGSMSIRALQQSTPVPARAVGPGSCRLTVSSPPGSVFGYVSSRGGGAAPDPLVGLNQLGGHVVELELLQGRDMALVDAFGCLAVASGEVGAH
jgi:hypothetical protein